MGLLQVREIPRPASDSKARHALSLQILASAPVGEAGVCKIWLMPSSKRVLILLCPTLWELEDHTTERLMTHILFTNSRDMTAKVDALRVAPVRPPQPRASAVLLGKCFRSSETPTALCDRADEEKNGYGRPSSSVRPGSATV